VPAQRIAIAEDAALLREGLTAVLERFGHVVVASVGDARALIDAVGEHRPDIVITDVRMPPTFTDEGLRAARWLQSQHPDLAVLVLSQYVDQAYAAELLDTERSAGVGYLLKDRVGDVADFVAALGTVARGGTVVDPEVVRQLLGRRRTPLLRLTPRETEVLALMAEGQSNTAIARTMVITEAAVAKHISGIFLKLDLPSAGEGHRRVLAVLAYLRG
jgi:DNA-binding NarL/FixJ family response regulator